MTAAAVTAATARRAARGVARGGVRRERHDPAYALLLAAMALTAIGIVMVYSASSVRSYFNNADPAAQGLEQLVWAGIGLVGMVVAMRIDFRHLRYLAIPIFVITLAMLVVRTPIEEAKLVERFGDDYRRYMARTNRFIPTLLPRRYD